MEEFNLKLSEEDTKILDECSNIHDKYQKEFEFNLKIIDTMNIIRIIFAILEIVAVIIIITAKNTNIFYFKFLSCDMVLLLFINFSIKKIFNRQHLILKLMDTNSNTLKALANKYTK